MEMNKTYNPNEFEDRIYKYWLENKFFQAKVNPDKKPFTIMMPPPNITGQLHMGHALDQTIQDVLTRFKRMQGYEALWLPGTDHASIATEVKIVEAMRAEGLTKEGIGREEFLKRAWAWKDKYGGKIVEQVKRLGSSCDWDRLAFTMDERCSKAVKHVFISLYNKGLIFKGSRIINWCPKCKTAISDAEVEYKESAGNFWHIKYMAENGKDFVIVATTRPETMLGDSAVAVNPKDKRYAHLVGKNVILPLVGKSIPIISDDYVDMEFGTGAVKITPAHDANDFEVGLRHKLPVVRVMNDDGTINALGGKYEGQDRYEARNNIVKDLKSADVLVKIEPHTHNTQHCYRCDEVIEPIVSEQWFVSMKDLAEPAIKAVKTDDIEFIPRRFDKIYFNWMDNIKDWCISRQLWWGHRIPAYYCKKCGHMIVAEEMPKTCSKCDCSEFKQDEDVLDTWFSSGLWPFSTLGYPDKNADLDYFYPGDVLVTAYEIIFFWVARMIFSGFESMGKKPFDKVLIHGIMRDELGRKMSKSLGNGIDPLMVIDEFGADSLRFSLINGIAMGGDTRYLPKKTEASRNFMNKVWNASRFLIMNMESKNIGEIDKSLLSIADKWILTKLNEVCEEVTNCLEKYELGLAVSKLYDFVWSEFCDWYIELVKPALYGDNEKIKLNTLAVLKRVLGDILKLLHPFIPFITEEIYASFNDGSIMIKEYPKADDSLKFENESRQMWSIMEIIKGIRNLRAEMNVPPSKKAIAYIKSQLSDSVIKSSKEYLQKLAYCSDIIVVTDKKFDKKVTSIVTSDTEVFIPFGELVDVEKEIERLSGELKKADEEISRAKNKLNNQGFVAKAPEKLIEEEKQKITMFSELKNKLQKQVEDLR